MFKNHFLIAWRNIVRHKTTSVINILGLTLGVSTCLIIFLLARFEFRQDAFHPDRDRIYRVSARGKDLNGNSFFTGCVPNPTGEMLRRQVAGLETVAGFFVYDARVTIENAGKPARIFEAVRSEVDNNIIVAEPQYFELFKYKWLAGNPAGSLSEPFKVVLSEKEARRYFDDLPLDKIVGKQVIYNDSLRLTVSGVVEDWKQNSDLDFKDFISWATIDKSFLNSSINLTKWSNWDIDNQVFVKLPKGVAPARLGAQLSTFSKTYLKPTNAKPELVLQPLKDIHFDPAFGDEYTRKASLPVLYGLMAIAAFILLIAAINFVNLSTAQSAERAKEIGIRKVLGSSRRNLVLRFMSETFVLTVSAILLAALLVNPLLQLFRDFLPPGLTFSIAEPGVLLFLLLLAVATSFLAGFYPARIVSSYLPALVLKGQSKTSHPSHAWLRKSLVVFQFTVSLLFIIGTLVIGRQIHFMLNKDLGYTKDAIVHIKTQSKEPVSKRDVFVQEIRHLPGVSMVSISQAPVAAEMQNGTIMVYKGKQRMEIETANIMADEHFLPLYGIKLLAGNNYPHSDTINQLLINETAVRSLGFKNPAEAIGQSVFIGVSDRPHSEQVFPITGVVADFHLQSLHAPISPLFLAPSSSLSRVVNIKLNNIGQARGTLAAVGKIWARIYPGKPFEYHWFDETIAAFYEREQKTAKIINAAMAVAIFISCMGLFGLITFSTEQRRKEIGVRKVLGASVQRITVLLCKDLVYLVLSAILIASPIAWYFMHQWLQDFPYRTSISWVIFVMAGLSAIAIALITVSIQAIRAAMANPVMSLRSE